MTAGGPGQLLFEFVRYWSHRAAGDSTIARQGRLVMFTEAVNSLVQRGRKATVNAVAHELGIDQSGASRLLSDAHSAGYVEPHEIPRINAAATSPSRRRASPHSVKPERGRKKFSPLSL